MAKNVYYQENILMLILAFTGLCVVGQLYLPLPLLPALAERFVDMPFSVAWFVSAFGYAYAIGFLLFGVLSDKFGRKTVILFGLLALTFSTAWVAWASSAWELLIARALQGFTAASFPPVALAYVNERFAPERRGVAVACLSFAFLSAVALAQAFVLLLGANTLQLPERILLLIYLLLAVALYLLLQGDNKRNSNASLWTLWRGLPALLCSAPLWRFYLLALSLLFVFIGFYLALIGQMDSQFSPLALRLYTLPCFLLCFYAAPLMKKVGAIQGVIFALAVGLSSFILSAISLYAQNALVLLLALCLLSASVALLVPLLIACMAQQAQAEQRGAAVALYTFVLFCGASAAPLIFAYLTSWQALISMSGLWLLGLFLMIYLPKTQGESL